MTNTALVLDHKPLILEVLSEHFSEASLERTLGLGEERVPWRVWDEALYGPLSDFLSRPGKEFRGRLVSMAWELAGQKSSPPPELALVVEVLHAGSLIVDDIEDDSSYRRGELALHKKWGLPRALNAGSWLYFWPDALLERMQLAPPIELGVRRAIDRTLLSAHHGQALDLSTRVFDLTQSEVPDVVSVTTRLKTGMLMQLAASLGAIAAGGPRQVTQALARFGMKLGAGLQMLDDLGGIVSVERCHKGHEDLTSARPTWLFAERPRSSTARRINACDGVPRRSRNESSTPRRSPKSSVTEWVAWVASASRRTCGAPSRWGACSAMRRRWWTSKRDRTAREKLWLKERVETTQSRGAPP
ncbi:MAG: polyprenyl synthetase family protein [Polyangiaceae bacterium]